MFSNSSSSQLSVARPDSNVLELQSLYQERKDAIQKRLLEFKHVMGLGYKEASHFLRNIGLGEEFAILDRHILRNLARLKVIPEVPASITKKRYLEIEEKLRRFAADISIPMAELDLLFWSKETGWIFK